jgi:hypothetical protein
VGKGEAPAAQRVVAGGRGACDVPEVEDTIETPWRDESFRRALDPKP